MRKRDHQRRQSLEETLHELRPMLKQEWQAQSPADEHPDSDHEK
jgi:hypothetical protein